MTVLFSFQLSAQINGNGNIEKFTKNLEGLKSIDIQFNADIILDFSQKSEEMTIECDENIIDFIGMEFKNGELTLDQKKWVEPSTWPKIYIGSPHLISVYQGTHSSTELINLDAKFLRVEGNVGTVTAQGAVKNLELNSIGTDMDFSKVEVDQGRVKMDGYAKIVLDKINKLTSNIDKKSKLVLMSEPTKHEGNTYKAISINDGFEENPDLRYIKFEIKNNSWRRLHFYVKGPKKDGLCFSYGFSMFPKTTRDENWSIGTRVYKETRMGGRELLVTITEENEGQVVSLFK